MSTPAVYPGAEEIAAVDPGPRVRRAIQRLRLLWWYWAIDQTAPGATGADMRGLTDEEAAQLAGLFGTASCWWHRCSDLREERLIEPHAVGQHRRGVGRLDRQVCVITTAGRAVLRAHRLIGPDQ